jgi:putative transposase
MKAATETLDSVIVERPLKKQNLCLDKGYDDYPEIERESTKRRYVPHIRQRGEEKELIKLRYYYSAKRWVVIERTNSWHNRFRKLLVRYEKKSENYLALLCLACCIIVYRRIILGYALKGIFSSNKEQFTPLRPLFSRQSSRKHR